jgi:hypothetical protein
MTTQQTSKTAQLPKDIRYCPKCDTKVNTNEASCHYCHNPLYKGYSIAVILSYLWAAIPAGISFILIKLIETLFNFQNRTIEMAVFGVVFLGVMGQKKAALLAKRDLAIYRQNSKIIDNNPKTNLGNTESHKPYKINEELLKDTKVTEFYKQTYDAWNSGRMDGIAIRYREVTKAQNLENFIKDIAPTEGSVLEQFFTIFPPLKNEFLIGTSDKNVSENLRGWFILTNLRLILRDGITLAFKEIKLCEITDFKISSDLSTPCVFNLDSGISIEISKVKFFPKKEYVQYAKHMN